ncbi:RidA family protein [Saccharopolyspora erythraea]|uniref:RidA family protein n=1 Tax=Saccharopolyspora erythraea TaxID=1836 RepID=UPI001BA551DA|nr:Rid family hydrolase [Saccharopolyspora erythraea]QUH04265.1 RidA family protein [Saccharopolyspora erythraea]
MSRLITNPAGLHDPVPFGYSHVVEATGGNPVFIAGQYGSGEDGQVVSPGFAEQVERAFSNLGTALAAVGLTFEHVVRVGTYVVDHDADKLQVLAGQVARIWGDRPPAQTLIGVAALALPGMLFEIDAVAIRPA